MHLKLIQTYPPDFDGELHIYYEEGLKGDHVQFHFTVSKPKDMSVKAAFLDAINSINEKHLR